jgi:phosphomethylpyrimidine synthase
VRISKEIEEFVSGKDEAYAWDKASVSAPLSPEQQEILRQRGVLTPQEIHDLAAKTSKAVGPLNTRRAACHSDQTDEQTAKKIQQEKLVKLNTAPAHNLPTGDSII